MMKKIIIIMMLLGLISILNMNKKKEVQLVYLDQETQDNYSAEYDIFYLDFRNSNLTSNNFLKYFNKDITVIKVYPYINPIYKNKLDKRMHSYDFSTSNLNTNLVNLNDFYINMLKKNGTSTEYENVYLMGVKIDMVKIYANYIDVYQIIKKDKNIKFFYNLDETID